MSQFSLDPEEKHLYPWFTLVHDHSSKTTSSSSELIQVLVMMQLIFTNWRYDCGRWGGLLSFQVQAISTILIISYVILDTVRYMSSKVKDMGSITACSPVVVIVVFFIIIIFFF